MQMKNFAELPEKYLQILEIDLQKNKRLAILLNGASLLVAAAMIIPVLFFKSVTLLFDMSNMTMYFVRFGVILLGLVAYMILHELVHGIFMKVFSGVKPTYGFTGLYAYAGSTAYFCKKSYIIIALAPVVIWGAALSVLRDFVPDSWFWVVYFIQVCNVSGAVGDFYVTIKFTGLPKDILVNDSGTSMRVYSAEE